MEEFGRNVSHAQPPSWKTHDHLPALGCSLFRRRALKIPHRGAQTVGLGAFLSATKTKQRALISKSWCHSGGKEQELWSWMAEDRTHQPRLAAQ